MMKYGLFLSIALLLMLGVSCDEAEPAEDEDAYPIGVALRASNTELDPCPEGLRCAEWCEVFSDGTEKGTGLTCCVSAHFVDASTDPLAFSECLANLRSE